MKAAVFHNCGDASQIQIAEVPEPRVGSGHLYIHLTEREKPMNDMNAANSLGRSCFVSVADMQ